MTFRFNGGVDLDTFEEHISEIHHDEYLDRRRNPYSVMSRKELAELARDGNEQAKYWLGEAYR